MNNGKPLTNIFTTPMTFIIEKVGKKSKHTHLHLTTISYPGEFVENKLYHIGTFTLSTWMKNPEIEDLLTIDPTEVEFVRQKYSDSNNKEQGTIWINNA